MTETEGSISSILRIFRKKTQFCLYIFICIYINLYLKAAHVAEDFSPNENDKAMERIKKLGPGTNKKKKEFSRNISVS